jgi:hypothetical protein
MPTLEEFINNKTSYPDDTKIALADGVETTLGQLRTGYMKDADYRRKTAEVAEQRRTLTEQQTTWEAARIEAENKLADVAKRLLSERPTASRDEMEDYLANDPVAQRLVSTIGTLEKRLESIEKTTTENAQRQQEMTRTYLADQHRRVLTALKTKDPELDEQELINFARENYIPRLDHAHRLMTYDKGVEAEKKSAREEGRKAGYEKARLELMQPKLDARRVMAPVGDKDAPKTFDDAATAALNDPEIQKILTGDAGSGMV